MSGVNSPEDIPVHRLVTQVIITPLLFLYLLVGVWIRIYKNYDAAYHKTPYLSKKLKYRIILNGLLIGVYLSTIVLSFHFKSFWLSTAKALSLSFLIPVISIACEIRALFFSYYRRLALLRSIHLASWGIVFVSETLAMAYTLIFDGVPETPELVHDMAKGLLLFVRVIIQWKYPQDRDEFDDPSRLSEDLLSPSLEARLNDLEDRRPSLLLSRKKIAFERKKERAFTQEPKTKQKLDISAVISQQVTQKPKARGKGKEIQYQILVNTFGKQHKVGRSLEEFQKLEQELKHDVNASILSQQSVSSLGGLAVAEDPDSISSSVKILQNFLDGILNKEEALPISVVNFLDIPDRKRVFSWNELMREPQKFEIKPLAHHSFGDGQQTDSSLSNNEGHSLNRIEKEIHSDDESEGESRSRAPSDGDDKLNTLYCQYFQVTIPKWQKSTYGDHYEFTISITHSEHPSESWEIVKRYSDFVKLRESLINEIHCVPPPLPSKKVRHDHNVLIKRKNGLENFLRIILNEKLYLQTKCVQDFIKLKKEFMSVIYGDEELQDFNNRRAEIRDNRIILRDKKKPVTEFEIKILEYSRVDPSFLITETKIYRKLKDFEELHKALKARYSSSLEILPQLPAKYNEFSGQTKVETIMEGLERYLNAAFQLPKVGDSFAFRKFVSYSKKFQSFNQSGHPKEIETSQMTRKNTLKEEEIDSLKIDSLVSIRAKKHSDDIS